MFRSAAYGQGQKEVLVNIINMSILIYISSHIYKSTKNGKQITRLNDHQYVYITFYMNVYISI